ncbi:MAG: hypothetical protein RSE41_00830 [Clostridia bacterium]
MIIVRNKIIPFKGFSAINLFGILFVRKNVKLNDTIIRHEKIHTKQMQEMLYLLFYLWYLIEWLVRLCMKGNAYKNISFEREARENQNNINYLKNRNFKYKWLKYLHK